MSKPNLPVYALEDQTGKVHAYILDDTQGTFHVKTPAGRCVDHQPTLEKARAAAESYATLAMLGLGDLLGGPQGDPTLN